ncbi:MAG: DUF1501 domain-containing protein [Gammaproteobacteria bacterium]|nr:DUF1501 domain-containing protein [Gammaproteobacteria bacterium]
MTRSERRQRRRVLQGVLAGGVAGVFGHLPGAVYAQALSTYARFADYKALVCVFLFGGNDSWNMVVPRSAAEYQVYQLARQNLALDQASLLPITPLTALPDGAQLGLHPSMPEIAALFEQDGVCAAIANVGPLIAPTTLAQYQAHSVPVPPQLFSHNDQQDQWHSLRGTASSRTGWAGRIADALGSQTGPALPLNISLFGQTLYQVGASTQPYVIGPTGPVEYFGLDGRDALSVARKGGFEAILGGNHTTLYERALAAVQRRALDSAQAVNAALAMARAPNAAPFATAFPDSSLGIQLRTVAEMIAVRDTLQASRQIFLVATGGFDSHDDQLRDQPALLANVSACLNAFYRATAEMGVAQSVTAFTQSDFGRTLTSNGDGTDHAWGGVQLVVGGAVRGHEVYGHYPLLRLGATLAADGADDVGGGRFIPTTSSDQYAATLARWFGVLDADLVRVAPGLGNFPQHDLGFMS